MRQKLEIENPAFAAEWDCEKNAGLNIDDYTGGSNKYVWWRCAKHGHSWRAQINKRFSRNQKCRICGNHEVLAGFNDIATTHRHLADEWHRGKNGVKFPQHYTQGADIKVWWKCSKCGYEWEAAIYSRTSKKPTGCPCCVGNVLVVGKNDLQTVNPDLAAQLDKTKNQGLRACDIAANDNRKAWWTDNLGHSWEATIASRNSGKDCPYCNNRLLLRGFNDLAARNPDLTKDWDKKANAPIAPRDVMQFSHEYAWWVCKCGNRWRARIANRSAGTSCPKCHGKSDVPVSIDLLSLRPEIAAAWDYKQNYPLTPDKITSQSNQVVWWLCPKCEQSFLSSVSNRRKPDHCPYCHGKRPIVGKTDFASVHPELLADWDYEQNPLPPTDYTCGSDKRVWWHCAEGHSWRTAIVHRHHGSKCRICEALKDKHIIIIGGNDLASQCPDIAAQWDTVKNKELTAEQVMPRSNIKVWWTCNRNHSWLASVLSRTLGTRCPRCIGKMPMRTHFIT